MNLKNLPQAQAMLTELVDRHLKTAIKEGNWLQAEYTTEIIATTIKHILKVDNRMRATLGTLGTKTHPHNTLHE